MQKKHSFSPNHKVVTDSKHNFHPHGAPTTAGMGQPPSQMGAGGDGTQAPQEGESQGGGMDGMNFCNGGMKYADGGDVPDIKGGGIRGTLSDYGNAIKQTGSDAVDSIKHSLSMDRTPGQPTRHEQQINDYVDEASK